MLVSVIVIPNPFAPKRRWICGYPNPPKLLRPEISGNNRFLIQGYEAHHMSLIHALVLYEPFFLVRIALKE